MTILGSREHTCIEPTVSKMRNKNEGCKELNEEQFGCSFKSKVKDKLGDHHLLNQYYLGLKTISRKKSYFVVK